MKDYGHNSPARPPWRSPFGFGLLIALGIILFFLWTEHRAHLLGALPFLLLLLCPLMHLFMHRGHRHRHHASSGKDEEDEAKGGRP